MDRVVKATGGKIQTTVNGLSPNCLGTCGSFSEKQVGAERFNIFTECPKTQTATIILRGGADQFIQEAERSLNDAIMIVRRAIKAEHIVAGGGAIDLELSKHLKEYSNTISTKEKYAVMAYAKALEVIPRTLADNAGLDSNDILNRLRKLHYTDDNGKNFGVDVDSDTGIQNSYSNYVWEPIQIKRNIISAATEVFDLLILDCLHDLVHR